MPFSVTGTDMAGVPFERANDNEASAVWTLIFFLFVKSYMVSVLTLLATDVPLPSSHVKRLTTSSFV